jgi:TRAP-type C4-dicarboxylate transport system permease small subunit
MGHFQGDFAYGLTVVWGLTAVHVNQKERYPAVGTSTLICNIAILGACAFAALRMLVPAFRTATNYSILATPDGDE